jgi:hypothetical protein
MVHRYLYASSSFRNNRRASRLTVGATGAKSMDILEFLFEWIWILIRDTFNEAFSVPSDWFDYISLLYALLSIPWAVVRASRGKKGCLTPMVSLIIDYLVPALLTVFALPFFIFQGGIGSPAYHFIIKCWAIMLGTRLLSWLIKLFVFVEKRTR